MSARYSPWLILFLITSAYGDTNISTEETHHVGWKSEPNGRGTLGILFPCLITIGLCAWTAIHIDIIARPTSARTTFHQIKWPLKAVIVPDVTVTHAQDQYWEARAVKLFVEQMRAKKEGWCSEPTNKTCVHEPACSRELPLSVAYFIIMGGLVIDPGTVNALPLTLTHHGFAAHYRKGLIPDRYLDLADLIEDKSKASGLSKFIVCSQTLVSASLHSLLIRLFGS